MTHVSLIMKYRQQREERKRHELTVKKARGTACFGALAAHFGTDTPKKLELRIDRRDPYWVNGDLSLSNKYLRWRQGGAAPHDNTLAQVEARTAGSVRLGFWRDLPLWELLALQPPPLPRLHSLLEQMPRNIRKILFFEQESRQTGRLSHGIPDRSQILAIRNLRSLDAFLALLCLARKGELVENDPLHFLPAACAFDILPRVLYTYKPLRYRWENLFECLHLTLWSRIYEHGAKVRFHIEVVREGLASLDADPRSTLASMTGIRVRSLPTHEIDLPTSHIEAVTRT
ncbi:MAG: hypothetical protein Q8S02_18065 [Hydrogenophaga sp.]|nr:hypothetical protein [Hydrogenophaga sp.]